VFVYSCSYHRQLQEVEASELVDAVTGVAVDEQGYSIASLNVSSCNFHDQTDIYWSARILYVCLLEKCVGQHY
jgi:hypothetical protein